jgi:hypothetical protein
VHFAARSQCSNVGYTNISTSSPKSKQSAVGHAKMTSQTFECPDAASSSSVLLFILYHLVDGLVALVCRSLLMYN